MNVEGAFLSIHSERRAWPDARTSVRERRTSPARARTYSRKQQRGVQTPHASRVIARWRSRSCTHAEADIPTRFV